MKRKLDRNLQLARRLPGNLKEFLVRRPVVHSRFAFHDAPKDCHVYPSHSSHSQRLESDFSTPPVLKEHSLSSPRPTRPDKTEGLFRSSFFVFSLFFSFLVVLMLTRTTTMMTAPLLSSSSDHRRRRRPFRPRTLFVVVVVVCVIPRLLVVVGAFFGRPKKSAFYATRRSFVVVQKRRTSRKRRVSCSARKARVEENKDIRETKNSSRAFYLRVVVERAFYMPSHTNAAFIRTRDFFSLHLRFISSFLVSKSCVL